MARRRVVILGSTGSIGTQALALISRHREAFEVVGVAAHGSDPPLIARQVIEHDVSHVAVGDPSAAAEVRRLLADAACQAQVTDGDDAVARLAAHPCDVVLNGLAGAAGLVPTLAALDAGSVVALANKESLIIGGPLVKQRARPGQIRPVDSEHSAIAQCLAAGTMQEVSRLILTASGGPFRGWTRARLNDVTPQQALAHPTWSMGPLVTVNSATLVNKGLEVIEAHLLFDLPLDRIDVVVHPQSVVHSMVEFVDGSTIAQASPPDMVLPISWALGWPERIPGAAAGCDWSTASTWDFLPLDEVTFPAVALARRAGAVGGTAPAVFNAADEVCVQAFLEGRIPFTAIVSTIAEVLQVHVIDDNGAGPAGIEPGEGNVLSVERVLEADAWGRRTAAETIARRKAH